jgi:pimeloyl-ACP methyl ester carboxylesterase
MSSPAAAPLGSRSVEVNGLTMHVVEAGPADGHPLLLLHGFPETWRSWRHQIPVLAAAGYRVIAPDQRGFGRTDAPPRVEDYAVDSLAADAVGLLRACGAESAIVIGHDWGAALAWLLARLEPDAVEAIAGLSVPFTPRPKTPPIATMRAQLGDRFHYLVYFQAPGPADAELGADARRTLATWYAPGQASTFLGLPPAEGTGVLDVLGDASIHPRWLEPEALDEAAAEFARTGFTGGLNWYRNLDRNWELTEPIAGAKVTQPALFVAGAGDAVIQMWPPEHMAGWVADLRGSHLIPGAGHWIQQEKPAEVNALLLGWLGGL